MLTIMKVVIQCFVVMSVKVRGEGEPTGDVDNGQGGGDEKNSKVMLR
jgi:hypothetical protein